MIQTYFIFIMILILIFSKYNAGYEKRHHGDSILQEKKVKKTIDNLSLVDGITRIISDLFIFS